MTKMLHRLESDISANQFATMHQEVTAIVEFGRQHGYNNFFGTVYLGSWEYGGGPYTWNELDELPISIDAVEHEWGFSYHDRSVLTPAGWVRIECRVVEWHGGIGMDSSRYDVYFDERGNIRRIKNTLVR